MLRLIQSNKMEVLASALVANISAQNDEQLDPFLPTQILVQSPGMAQWLKVQVAEALGIAANLQFPLPSSYIWSLYQDHLPELPEQSAFTKPNMTWKLMTLLPECLQLPEFAPIRQYLQDAPPIKRYHLCHKIADVFDQYLVYRPDWITIWEQGENQLPDVSVDEQVWQPILWRKLVAETARLKESGYHRANLHLSLLAKLAGHNTDPSPLHVFGISAIPQQQLEVLSMLAKNTDVFLYWCNPSMHYWGDLIDRKTLARKQTSGQDEETAMFSVGNPLLASWGKLGRDYLDMLMEAEAEQFDAFIPDTVDTMLGSLQDEIQQLTHRGSIEPLPPEELITNGVAYPKFTVSENDDSIQVHICHSRIRELEVLHQTLLHAFQEQPDLDPGDIIVMMPDVSAYAPYIDAVFQGQGEHTGIPYAVSDLSIQQDSGMIASFIQLMSLHQSRITLRDIRALLDVPAIQRKFELNHADITLLFRWLQEAGVRWGWDAQDKQRWSLPEEHDFTWLFGLERLLSGYAMTSNERVSFGIKPLQPFNDVEGQAVEALGKLYVFIQRVKAVAIQCIEHSALATKIKMAQEAIETLYAFDDQEQVYANQVREAIESLSPHCSQFSGDISQDVFVFELEQRLSDKGVGQRFLAGYVNFCTLMPMRSVPFKWVCLIGLNDQDYPRQTSPLGFDLMQNAQSRRGDRSRRLDDRYLFLEAILSARSTLYLSYQGFSVRDNSPRTASVLLEELLDYCDSTFALEHSQTQGHSAEQTVDALRAHLTRVHPLQPFSPEYFIPEASLTRGFSSQWLAVAAQSLEREGAPGAFLTTSLAAFDEVFQGEIPLDMVIDVLTNPAKGLFRYRWHTSLNLREDTLEDDEFFVMSGLERYQLLHQLISSPEQTAPETLKAAGRMPLGNVGPLLYKKVAADADSLRQRLAEACLNKDARRLEIYVELTSFTMSSWCDLVYGDNLVMWRAGKLRGKDRLIIWLTWLGLCASEQGSKLCEAVYLATDKTLRIPRVERQDARDLLEDYGEIVTQSLRQPVFFFPDSAWTWVTSKDMTKVLNHFAGNDFQSGEGQEPHIARMCPDLSGVAAQFHTVSERVFMPLLEIAMEGKA